MPAATADAGGLTDRGAGRHRGRGRGRGGGGCDVGARGEVRNDNADLSSPGDSGGPVFWVSSARGITSGSTWNTHRFCECNNVFTPIEYAILGLNVSPMTH